MIAMIRSFKNILFAAGAAVLCFSCQDYLNTPPVDSLSPNGYYSTPNHVEEGIRGGYAKLRDIEVGQYLLLSEDRSDNMWADPAPNGIRSCSEIAFFRFDSSTGDVKNLWANWYSLIYNVNAVLANIDAVEFRDGDIKNQFKGELLFLRGYAHFELARVFGNVPIVDHNLSSAEAKTLKQSSPADVINNRVLPDLKEAESLLPYEDGVKNAMGAKIGGQGRADKIVAKAMLARVYMTLKGWPYNDASSKAQAKSYLEDVLKYSKDNGDKYWAPTAEEWQKQWLTEPVISNKYQIFSIQHRLSSGNGLSGQEGYSLSGEYLPKGGGGGLMTPVFIEASLRYEYMKNNDKRGLGQAFMDGYDAYGSTPPYSNTEIRFTYDGKEVTSYEESINVKFCPFVQRRQALGVEFDDNTLGGWPLNFPILRLEDMMLLYAELLTEDGDISGAMGYVNRIRSRAGVPEVEASGKDEAMDNIKTERKLEFFLEGIRWFDQIRSGEWERTTVSKFDRYKIDGNYRQGVSIDNIKPGKYLAPIPLDEMNAVPMLYQQNPDWDK